MTGLLSGVKYLGAFQRLELAVYDYWVRSQPELSPDPRLLVVGITETDIQAQNTWPLSDQVVTRLLAKLQAYNPKAIGLDLYRDVAHPPGTQAALARQLQAPNVISITNLGSAAESVPSPPGVPSDQVGFNDFVLDPDGVVRRNFMFAAVGPEIFYSFSLRLALLYLSDQADIQFERAALTIGNIRFERLQPNAGGYFSVDTLGYQTLLRYRSASQVAQQITLTQLLEGDFDPSWIRGKVVLVGTTALSAKDNFYTPYGFDDSRAVVIPGVLMHAQATSQILSTALGERTLFRYWPQWAELLWTLSWACLGSLLIWQLKRPLGLGIVILGGLLGLSGITGLLFANTVWVPLVLPASVYLCSAIGMLAYKEFYRTFYDSTTGLPNRTWLLLHLQRLLNRSQTDKQQAAAIFLDVDRLQKVNESFGHATGDYLLQTIAKRLQHSLPRQARLVRLESDEFVVLLERVIDDYQVAALAKRLQEELAHPIFFEDHKLINTVSAGIALQTLTQISEPTSFLQDAETAMRRAKQQGKSRLQIFSTGMRSQASTRFLLEADLHQAVEQQQLRLHYQPLIDLSTGKIAGFEALIRWQHPEKGLIFPNDFISLAEENGLIVPIGYWVIEEACRQTRTWHEKYPHLADLFVSVNLSGQQFTETNLVNRIAEILEKTQYNRHTLKLELTESVVMDNVDSSIAVLLRLKDLDLKIGIDDFGTGYSSLSYLHRFPIDTLKVDRSFVMRMEDTCENAEIVKTIIALGHNLKMSVVAEGVETESQAQRLRSLNCEYGQGYFFAKPVAPDAAERLLQDNPQYLE
ncbi:MAG: EAL domain-containing protein [Leptolyngbya sp. SIO4C1]|nr:EAL domain-containing protein [Leptolyngbya sp. SIO4C1]